jgi:hypothetical protein
MWSLLCCGMSLIMLPQAPVPYSRCHTTRGHDCVYSATDEALDTLCTKSSKRVYRFMHIFFPIVAFLFHLFLLIYEGSGCSCLVVVVYSCKLCTGGKGLMAAYVLSLSLYNNVWPRVTSVQILPNYIQPRLPSRFCNSSSICFTNHFP